MNGRKKMFDTDRMDFHGTIGDQDQTATGLLKGVPWFVIAGMLILIPIIVFMISISLGQYQISLKNVGSILLSQFIPIETEWEPIEEKLVMLIRLPRIVAAMMVGASLAMSGAAFQGLFRNPLADAYTLGVSNGAGFGAALGILLINKPVAIQLMAQLFSLIAVALTFLIRGRTNRSSVSFVLGGVIVGSFFSALVSLIKYVADTEEQLPAIVYWLMGSLASVNRTSLLWTLPMFIVSFILLYAYRWRLNLMSMGDDEAKSFGIDIQRDRIMVILLSTLMTSCAVSISGIIGWVGLVIPHLGRSLVGPDYRKLLPVCLSLGAAYMLVIDSICRLFTEIEIPLGIVTALVGTPIFVYFMKRDKVNW